MYFLDCEQLCFAIATCVNTAHDFVIGVRVASVLLCTVSKTILCLSP